MKNKNILKLLLLVVTCISFSLSYTHSEVIHLNNESKTDNLTSCALPNINATLFMFEFNPQLKAKVDFEYWIKNMLKYQYGINETYLKFVYESYYGSVFGMSNNGGLNAFLNKDNNTVYYLFSNIFRPEIQSNESLLFNFEDFNQTKEVINCIKNVDAEHVVDKLHEANITKPNSPEFNYYILEKPKDTNGEYNWPEFKLNNGNDEFLNPFAGLDFGDGQPLDLSGMPDLSGLDNMDGNALEDAFSNALEKILGNIKLENYLFYIVLILIAINMISRFLYDVLALGLKKIFRFAKPKTSRMFKKKIKNIN
jgi:hypothetical protein